MRNITLAGLLSILAVLFAGRLAVAGQAQLWTTSTKLSCDRSVMGADTINVKLCEDATCSVSFDAGGLECGSNLGLKSTGHRFDTKFKPTAFSFTVEVRDQNNNVICSNSGEGMPMGTTVTCNGSSSPKFTVGRPH